MMLVVRSSLLIDDVEDALAGARMSKTGRRMEASLSPDKFG
jgi:hypothetical protein